MPEIIGIVDGTHVAITMPHENEHVFVNRKGYHSLNCQLVSTKKYTNFHITLKTVYDLQVCDAELKILNVVARWPGSTHDAFIWRSSIVAQIMRGNFENINDNSKIMGMNTTQSYKNNDCEKLVIAFRRFWLSLFTMVVSACCKC